MSDTNLWKCGGADLVESMKSTLLWLVLCSKGVTVSIIKQVLNLVIPLTVSGREYQGGGVRQRVPSKHCHCQVSLCCVRLGVTSEHCHCQVSGMAAINQSLPLLQRSHWDEWRLGGPSFMQIAADRAWVGRYPVLDTITQTYHCFWQYYSDISLFLTILLRHITVLHNIT